MNNKFGDVLRLHRFSVVAVGFERLVYSQLESFCPKTTP
uniref:Uncharacterized protein n=1 Tax=Candidatus Kentrum sp. MB TaxID=2138164 RepID=A0A450XR98_9GAMM|nr:MAG: hypothetical protein BECKMB1821G_GA0114241_109315 [Candidatus Kentron sp. MB]